MPWHQWGNPGSELLLALLLLLLLLLLQCARKEYVPPEVVQGDAWNSFVAGALAGGACTRLACEGCI